MILFLCGDTQRQNFAFVPDIQPRPDLTHKQSILWITLANVWDGRLRMMKTSLKFLDLLYVYLYLYPEVNKYVFGFVPGPVPHPHTRWVKIYPLVFLLVGGGNKVKPDRRNIRNMSSMLGKPLLAYALNCNQFEMWFISCGLFLWTAFPPFMEKGNKQSSHSSIFGPAPVIPLFGTTLPLSPLSIRIFRWLCLIFLPKCHYFFHKHCWIGSQESGPS